MSEWTEFGGNRSDLDLLPPYGKKVDLYDKMFDKVHKDVWILFDPKNVDMDYTAWRYACICPEAGCVRPSCKGQCGCPKCHEEYMDFLSCE